MAAPAQAAPRRRLIDVRAAPDERLAMRVRAGDETAFEALYDRYHGELLAFCRHMLGSREEGEDVLQHVMVAAHRQLMSGADIALRPWLYAVARNRCISVLRSRRDATALDAVPEPTAEGLAVAAEVEQRDDLRAMLSDVARLPDDQRAALLLAELGALSHDEIAEALEVRREKVKALVFQAREALAGWRTAREASCVDIRAEIANARGGALRRGPLRKHLDVCLGCRAFSTEVKRQRTAMAMLLPVLPTLALKGKVLGAATTTGSLATAATGAGAGVGGAIAVGQASVAGGAAAGGITEGGLTAGGAGGLTAKALLVTAVAAAAGGGYAVVDTATIGSRGRPPLLRQVGLSDAGHVRAAVASGHAPARASGLRQVVVLRGGLAAVHRRPSSMPLGKMPVVLVSSDQLSATWAPQTLVPPTAVLTVFPADVVAQVPPAPQAAAGPAAGSPSSTSPAAGERNPDAPASGANETTPGQTKSDSGATPGNGRPPANSSAGEKSQGSGPPADSIAGANGNGNGAGGTSSSKDTTTSSSPSDTKGNGSGPPANSNAGGIGAGGRSGSTDTTTSSSPSDTKGNGKGDGNGAANGRGTSADGNLTIITGG